MDKKESRIVHGIIIALEILLIILVVTCRDCKDCGDSKAVEGVEDNSIADNTTTCDYNISLLLDLSDRLMTPQQIDKDTLLINYLADWFYRNQKSLPRTSIFQNGDRIKVFFYPQLTIAGLNQYQEDLSIDMSVHAKGKDKIKAIIANRDKLDRMKTTWHNALDTIYANTIAQKAWVGSDIWGFFEKQAKVQCINKNAKRNILVILTDGYLYHKDSWRKQGNNEYTGISPLTIDSQTKIISTNEDLSGLEVLFLEINPKKDSDFNKMKDLLAKWCNEMGIKHVDFAKTDLPANTKTIIEKFLN